MCFLHYKPFAYRQFPKYAIQLRDLMWSQWLEKIAQQIEPRDSFSTLNTKITWYYSAKWADVMIVITMTTANSSANKAHFSCLTTVRRSIPIRRRLYQFRNYKAFVASHLVAEILLQSYLRLWCCANQPIFLWSEGVEPLTGVSPSPSSGPSPPPAMLIPRLLRLERWSGIETGLRTGFTCFRDSLALNTKLILLFLL